MKVLAIGASSPQSLGYLIGQHLEKVHGHVPHYMARTDVKKGRRMLGIRYFQGHAEDDVESIIHQVKPEIIIYAAGVFTPAKSLDELVVTKEVKAHIVAKSIGVLATLAGAAKTTPVRKVIFLGGRRVSEEPGYAAYTGGNGFMWAMVQFAAKHEKRFTTHFVDMPPVLGSAMGDKYIADPATADKTAGAVSVEDVIRVVEAIIAGGFPSGYRNVLGEGAV